MDTVKVTCGLIFDEERIFVCRRKKGKALAGYWEFPGGKVEPNETYEQCLKRELEEELGMQVNVVRHFRTVEYSYELFNIELISFVCEYVSSTLLMTDHDKYEWTTTNDLLRLNLAPADIEIAKALILEK